MPNIKVNTTILLPADMYWSDEFKYTAMGSKVTHGLTGALIIQQARKKVGARRITLSSGRDTALLERQQLEDLEALCETFPPVVFELEFADGRTFNVQFDSTDGAPIEADALQPGKVPAPDDLFTTTLRFMEIPA